MTTAYPVETKTEKEIRNCLLDYFETYQLNPKYIVADMAFKGSEMESFFNRKKIISASLRPATPWPNRAEAGVRLLRRQVDITLKTVGDAPALANVTYRQLLWQACIARNSSVTFAGGTLLEMAFRLGFPDIASPQTQDPVELTATFLRLRPKLRA